MNFGLQVSFLWDQLAILLKRRSKFEKIAFQSLKTCNVTQQVKTLLLVRRDNQGISISLMFDSFTDQSEKRKKNACK